MPKEEWGVKRVCPKTGKRFYDMNRSPVISPYTGEVVSIDTGTRTRVLVADKSDDEAKIKTSDGLLIEDNDDTLDDDLALEEVEDVLEEDESDGDDMPPLGKMPDVGDYEDNDP